MIHEQILRNKERISKEEGTTPGSVAELVKSVGQKSCTWSGERVLDSALVTKCCPRGVLKSPRRRKIDEVIF